MSNFTFLICSERSGSNLVARVMNGHPRVCGPSPSHMFRLFANNGFRYQPFSVDENWHRYLQMVKASFENMIGQWQTRCSIDDLLKINERTIAAPLRLIYENEAQFSDADKIFVKENHTYQFAPFLLANFPSCRFVHQVRDPRDVAASWVKTAGTAGGVEKAVDVWVSDQTATLNLTRQLEGSGRLLTIRYEDLTANSQQAMEALCRHVGVDYSDAMERFFEDPNVKHNAETIEAWANLSKPILAGNSGNYKKTLSDNDLRYVELKCSELMAEFGYQADTDISSVAPSQKEDEIAKLKPLLTPGKEARTLTVEETEIRKRRITIINEILNYAPV